MFEKFKSNIADKFGFKNNNNNNTNNTNPLPKPNFKTTPLSQNNSNSKPQSKLAPTPTQSPAEVLYGEETKKQKQKEQKRNSLLNELGDSLTPAQVLYSDIDELETLKQEKRQSAIDNANYLGKFCAEDDAKKEEFETETNDNNGDEKEQNNKTQDSDFSPEDDLTDENETNEEANEEDDKEEDLNTQEDFSSNDKESIDNNDKNKVEGFEKENASYGEFENENADNKQNAKAEDYDNNGVNNENWQNVSKEKNWDKIEFGKTGDNKIKFNDDLNELLYGKIDVGDTENMGKTKDDNVNPDAKNAKKKLESFAVAQANKFLEEVTKFAIGDNYGKGLNKFAKTVSGEDTAGMLDLAHGIKMNDRNYIKDVKHFDNYDSIPDQNDRKFIKNKIKEQYADYGFDINKIKGYNFKEDSKPSERIAESKDFHNILKKHKNDILNRKDFSATFKKGTLGIFRNSNLYNAIGSFDVRNIEFDKTGNLRLKIYDTYDFNKNKTDFLNRAGRAKMESGELHPFFTIHDILIKKENLNEIWQE